MSPERRTESGTVVWLVGRPSSGKTTLARQLVSALHARGIVTLWLDSDDLREVLTPDAGYDEAGRDRFYGALNHLAELGARGGAFVVMSATASRRRYRDTLRSKVPRMVEVWIRCADATLEARDPKGLYAAARRGEVQNLPGVSAPFEAPEAAQLVLDSDSDDAEALGRQLLEYLESHGFLPPLDDSP